MKSNYSCENEEEETLKLSDFSNSSSPDNMVVKLSKASKLNNGIFFLIFNNSNCNFEEKIKVSTKFADREAYHWSKTMFCNGRIAVSNDRQLSRSFSTYFYS